MSLSVLSRDMIRPQRLLTGSKIGLITPASYIDEAELRKAVASLEGLGLKVVMGNNIRALYGGMAGKDAERLADLHSMFADPEIKGIWCARGGYGAARLLDKLDYDLIRRNPKVFVGYSDITALHCAIQQHCQLVTFLGPSGNSAFTDYTKAELQQAVFEPPSEH
eukprot:4038799-Amphidinium_carterae.1